MFCLSFYSSNAQIWQPVLRNSEGEIIQYTWPPPDSTYVRNELIIYFRTNALHLEKLCFDIYEENGTKKDNEPSLLSGPVSHAQRAQLFNQRFCVDSLIADSSLLAAIKYYGGDTLRRMSITSPCRDTIAISSVYKDTLKCFDYLYMVLHFNNDTSVVNAGINLNIFHQEAINWADLNMYYTLFREPSMDLNYGYQTSLHDELSGFNSAWDYQIGNGVKVAIIDNGIDYKHCDLGNGQKGPGHKVYAGWNYLTNNADDFWQCSSHGTQIAGIIGAYTDYSKCPTSPNGVADIAGGWRGPESEGGEGIGCQLIGLDVHEPAMCGNVVNDDRIWTAFKEACAWTRSGGGEFNAEIINFSAGTDDLPRIALRDAVNYAYQCGVSVVTAIGNYNDDRFPSYPAAYDPAWVTSVGASNKYKARVGYSNHGNNLDFIAPGGQGYQLALSPDKYKIPGENYDKIDFTTNFEWSSPDLHNLYNYFGGTSAAAPHIAGLIALLRADQNEDWNQVEEPLEPEDFEGMIKASCEDITWRLNDNSDGDEYEDYYDSKSGWGFIRADNMFDMLRNRGYRLYHIKNENYNSFNKTEFKSNQTIYFQNDGYPINKTWFIPPGLYSGFTIYKLEGTITINGNFLHDEDNPLFVWGRSGQGGKSGLDKSYDLADNNNQPTTYQSGFTEVTSGQGGNGYVNGIYHNQSLVVNVTTYQYEGIVKGQTIKLPPDEDLAANISVFGVGILDIDIDYKIYDDNVIVKLLPNPAYDYIELTLFTENPQKFNFSIFDYLGNEILRDNNDKLFFGISNNKINVSTLPPGVYVLKIASSQSIKAIKFVKGGK